MEGWRVSYLALNTTISCWSLPIWRGLHVFTEFKQSCHLIENGRGGHGSIVAKSLCSTRMKIILQGQSIWTHCYYVKETLSK